MDTQRQADVDAGPRPHLGQSPHPVEDAAPPVDVGAALQLARARRSPALRPAAIASLQRAVGNRSVTRLLGAPSPRRDRSLQRQPTTPASPDVAAKDTAFQAAITSGNWEEAARVLNGFSDQDIEQRVRRLLPAQLPELFAGALTGMYGWGSTPRITDPIRKIDPAAAHPGQQKAYEKALALPNWEWAVVFLNGFSDDDIESRLTSLKLDQLRELDKGAPAWVTRVKERVRAVLVSGSMGGMVGSKATWVPSGPMSADTFEKWASAKTEGTAPALTPATTINCWEVVMLAAHRAGMLTWKWIHDTYGTTNVAGVAWVNHLVGRLTPSGRTMYLKGKPDTPRPRSGDIVLFNGIEHVAMANGQRSPKGEEVFSFWPPPNIKVYGRGTIDQVKVTTIEELVEFMGSTTIVQFGRGPW